MAHNFAIFVFVFAMVSMATSGNLSESISLGKTKEAAESSKVVILVYPPKAPAGLRGE